MSLVARACLGFLVVGQAVGCGADDGVFDIEVQPCDSQADPIAFAVFYSVDDESTSCYVEPCNEESVAGCLIGSQTPDVPNGSTLEIQVVLYESGQSPVACSQPVSRIVDSDTTLVLPLQCDPPSVGTCPAPTSCSGDI